MQPTEFASETLTSPDYETQRPEQKVIPEWFKYQITAGIEHCARLPLMGRPRTRAETADMIRAFISQIWSKRVWLEEPFRRVIHAAFRELADGERFPTPKTLIEAMGRASKDTTSVTLDDAGWVHYEQLVKFGGRNIFMEYSWHPGLPAHLNLRRPPSWAMAGHRRDPDVNGEMQK